MKTYIVLDLEWNQSASGKAGSVENLPFEIIEIGAVKLDEQFNIVDEFKRIIKPSVYQKLHFKVLEVVHIGIDELRKHGEPFPQVIREFFDWCFSDKEYKDDIKPIFCSWGSMDFTELQRNMAYYKIDSVFPYPFLYYDIQKLYGLLYSQDTKTRTPLDRAVEALGLLEDGRPFHRALDDAYYSALVMQNIDFETVHEYISLDYYHIPKDEDEEIYLIFPDYTKYVSRTFESKEDAIADKTVTDMLCYRCNRMLKKKIRWFSTNQKNYYCLAFCPEHGLVKGKIRMKHTKGDRIFVVKTIKLIGEDGAAAILKRKEEAAKKRNEKNRLKRQRNR